MGSFHNNKGINLRGYKNPKLTASKYIKRKLKELQGRIEKSTIIRDFNTLLPKTDRTR